MLRATSGAFGGSNIASGVPTILGKSGIAFIHLSSGSVSAAGAITGITALPRAYANAYCYFPANALATSIAAGWYYCTFSTTTSGTAFLNTYTTGTPTVPASPTAVTDGKGAFTGVTSSEQGITLPVAANALGPNGGIRVYSIWENNNSAGTKSLRIRYGAGVAGTQYFNVGVTTSTYLERTTMILATGTTASQSGSSVSNFALGASTTATSAASTVDTTASSSVWLGLDKAVATDYAVVTMFAAELLANGA